MDCNARAVEFFQPAPQPEVGIHTSAIIALGMLAHRCRLAKTRIGPMQSCGVIGRCQASAIAEIFSASVMPPV